MMRLFELVSQALLVSRQDQEQATKPPAAPGHMPLDHLAQPMPSFMPRGNHSYDAVLSPDVDTSFADIKWTKDATQTTRAFNAVMQSSRFRTLAEIIDTVVPNCGVTKTSGKRVNVTGMSTMVWQNDKTREGFTQHGPCEAWIDKTRVFQSPNCRANHTAYPATIPIDYSVCGGNCIFKFYWLALDEPEWHAYKQCVPISTRTKALLRIEELIAAKAVVPLNSQLDTLKHNATSSSDSKHESKLAIHHDAYDDKKDRYDNADVKNNHREDGDETSNRLGSCDSDDINSDDSNSHNHLDPRSDGTWGVKHDEKNGSDCSYDSCGHDRHFQLHDDSNAPKPRDNTRRSTPSPTHSIYPTNGLLYPRDYNAGGKLDEQHDEKKESDDSENRHDRTHHNHIYDEKDVPKPRDDTRRPALPPAYAFYPMNKSMIISLPYQPFEEQMRHRRAYTDDDSDDSDDSLNVKKDGKEDRDGSDSGDSGRSGHASTPLQHRLQHQLQPLDDARRTPQPLSDRRSPVLHTSAALPRPRRFQGPSVVEQDTAAQTPEPILRVNRVNHLITL